MDLSHWDLVNKFTLREAACLAGGIEPLAYKDLPAEQTARADLIYRELAAAYSMAESAVSFALNSEGRFDPDETVESILFSAFLFDAPLAGTEMIREVGACLRSGRQFDSQRFHDLHEAPSFSRERLGDWFSLKGFQPIYSFVPTPDKDEQQKQFEPRPTTRAHVSDKLAKMNQAAERFWGNADRADRGTHPDNATVAAWLVGRGFSSTLADKAATIIRPEWAPTGRKPDE
jgi:hypothetical protein